MADKKIVALIPARGGSKGIPRKNIVDLGGQPLIAYNIAAAKGVALISEVYVSTDDKEIAEISKKYGARSVEQPADLARDVSSSESALLNFAGQVDFDVLVFLQCTSPLTVSSDVDAALKLYLNGRFDSVLSVTEDSGGFLCGGFVWSESGESLNYDYRQRPRRQDRPKTYRENGAIYITSREHLLKHKNRLSGRIGLYKMPGCRSFELDSPEELDFLRNLWPFLKGR